MTLSNIAAKAATQHANTINTLIGRSLETLTTSFRINKFSDNASGASSIADKLHTQAGSLSQSTKNVNSAVALLDIAEGAMKGSVDILYQIKQKLIQAADGTTNDKGRENIRKDINKLLTQFDNTDKNTTYNGIQVIAKADGTKTDALSFQMGEKAANTINTDVNIRANSEGLSLDSLRDFDGNYGFGKTDKKFPADAFVLNPPYSADGNGMVFVQTALDMMNKGYGAIIIQNSAGSGKAKEYTTTILEKHTLIASIKMPVDIFIGKASVQTNIYVFRVGEAHHKDEMVKFIDFSNDGYTRTNRKKASNNLKDTDNAKGRYEELVSLVKFGQNKLNIFTDKEYYEGHINPQNGADWNQSAPIDTKPTLDDFKKTVTDYLSWEVTNILKQRDDEGK